MSNVANLTFLLFENEYIRKRQIYLKINLINSDVAFSGCEYLKDMERATPGILIKISCNRFENISVIKLLE